VLAEAGLTRDEIERLITAGVARETTLLTTY
jgi:hypothetical protein